MKNKDWISIFIILLFLFVPFVLIEPSLSCVLFLSIILVISLSLSFTTTSSSGQDDFFDSIPTVLFINLNHRTDRLQEFKNNFPICQQDKLIRIEGVYEPKNGAVGCLKSHIIALEYAYQKKRKEKYVLICEDDFCINDLQYCQQMISYFLSQKKKKNSSWNVLMLGHNTSSHKKTRLLNIIRVQESQTTSAYIIKTKYIPKLLSIYKADLKAYEETGVWGNYFTDQSWKKLQKIDRWYAIDPRVGVQRESFSDIEKGIVNYNV